MVCCTVCTTGLRHFGPQPTCSKPNSPFLPSLPTGAATERLPSAALGTPCGWGTPARVQQHTRTAGFMDRLASNTQDEGPDLPQLQASCSLIGCKLDCPTGAVPTVHLCVLQASRKHHVHQTLGTKATAALSVTADGQWLVLPSPLLPAAACQKQAVAVWPCWYQLPASTCIYLCSALAAVAALRDLLVGAATCTPL